VSRIGFAAGLLLLGFVRVACADSLGPWRLDQTRASDGSLIHSASIASAVKLDEEGEVEDEPVVLSISCRPSGEPRWNQVLRLNEPLSSSGETTVDVTIDDNAPIEQTWIVDEQKRSLSRPGAYDIASLRTAKTLKLTWSLGWTWLWLSEDATFELGEVRPVLYVLSKGCRVPQP